MDASLSCNGKTYEGRYMTRYAFDDDAAHSANNDASGMLDEEAVCKDLSLNSQGGRGFAVTPPRHAARPEVDASFEYASNPAHAEAGSKIPRRLAGMAARLGLEAANTDVSSIEHSSCTTSLSLEQCDFSGPHWNAKSLEMTSPESAPAKLKHNAEHTRATALLALEKTRAIEEAQVRARDRAKQRATQLAAERSAEERASATAKARALEARDRRLAAFVRRQQGAIHHRDEGVSSPTKATRAVPLPATRLGSDSLDEPCSPTAASPAGLRRVPDGINTRASAAQSMPAEGAAPRARAPPSVGAPIIVHGKAYLAIPSRVATGTANCSSTPRFRQAATPGKSTVTRLTPQALDSIRARGRTPLAPSVGASGNVQTRS